MSTKNPLRRKIHRRIRFAVSTLLTLALASVICWGLVSIHEPQAKLTKITLRKVNDSYSKLYIQMQVINQNYFRGFNYTGGWVEPFYVSDIGEVDPWDLTYADSPIEFHGFRKTLNWNFTYDLTVRKMDWTYYPPLLKNKTSHIYVSVYLSYFYKILIWTTEGTYYQWLDANVYLNSTLDFEGVSDFNTTKDLTLAF